MINAFVQLTVHAWLTYLFKQNFKKIELFKYTQQHLWDMFDALYSKSEFAEQIFIIDFSLKTETESSIWWQLKLNLDENLNESIDSSDADYIRISKNKVNDLSKETDDDENVDELINEDGTEKNNLSRVKKSKELSTQSD